MNATREKQFDTKHEKSPERDYRLDTLRGVLLLIIFIDHTAHWWITKFTYQPLGFVSAMEGFIFLSGYTFSLVYSEKRLPFSSLFGKAVLRSSKIYLFHITLVGILLALSPSLAQFGGFWPTTNAIFNSNTISLLIYQTATFQIIPKYCDILPLYAVLFLLAPFALLACRRFSPP